MNNTLSIKNVTFSYGNKKVLNDISFNCSNGITALLGSNGVGKTTLMNILTGLKKPSSGEIALNDTDLLNVKNVPLSQIGYLPQNFEIYPNVVGYDFLSYICDLKGIKGNDKNKVLDEVINTFNLNDVIKLPFKKYSGGYKRRLGIAQAVLGDPSLVIIDEPTVGLDPEQRLEFRHYLSKCGEGRITLISTHIIEDAELYSNNILILNSGNVTFNGSVNEFISKALNQIYTFNCNIKQLNNIRDNVIIIEEKRLDNDNVKVKFINNDNNSIAGSNPEMEVSLENAYVYFQKQQRFL
ncbi:ATP-binding cassette domain-containing protein [Clostridium sp. MB40-C1]|uniref:ATP-binding cassette domain-containing protein n=1 Tax=Clostridium sp. MB40-C1 TaxID=3070996 RepID=UPI0027E19127|nr:ATP-binding cassette domain-containing protein [Clostridium sp. MB40-C1]WMJ82269.1 ATP-binding cassette domain-containing protein [Clostridium sp. MB40-C1]